MYIKFNKIHEDKISRWGKVFPILKLTMCWLYKDDDSYVKWITMTDLIKKKLENTKIDITIPELEWLLKDHEIDKLLPPEENIFASVPLFK